MILNGGNRFEWEIEWVLRKNLQGGSGGCVQRFYLGKKLLKQWGGKSLRRRGLYQVWGSLFMAGYLPGLGKISRTETVIKNSE